MLNQNHTEKGILRNVVKSVQSYHNLPFTKVASIHISFDHTYLTNKDNNKTMLLPNLMQIFSMQQKDMRALFPKS